MTDAQAREAEAIMREQQAEIEALRRKLQNSTRDYPEGGITSNRLCAGCYRWRCFTALWFGAGLGILVGMACETNGEFLKGSFGNAAAATFALVAIASLLPIAGVTLNWKIRLHKAGYPGVLRACANLLAEFKRGLRE
jgi:hypothetical protein